LVVYNKVVRDKIPEIILRDGKNPVFKSLDDAAFLVELENKLPEEVAEYL
jgi:predicted house-cleaning noncanonical NTP pyrophosphatase (MazG superfamily)